MKEMQRMYMENEYREALQEGLKPVMIEYVKPQNFFGMTNYYDIIIFDSTEEKESFINGKVAYDYIDNCMCLYENERVVK